MALSATELGCGSVRYGTVCDPVGDLRRRDLGSCQDSGRVTHAGPDGTGTVCSLCWPAEIFSGWIVFAVMVHIQSSYRTRLCFVLTRLCGVTLNKVTFSLFATFKVS